MNQNIQLPLIKKLANRLKQHGEKRNKQNTNRQFKSQNKFQYHRKKIIT